MTDSAGKTRKSSSAFRTISEVADDLDLPQHVLRFWETKFSQVNPVKRGGGRRYYRPEDISLLERIKNLLYAEGYTIKGVQKLLKDESSGNGSKQQSKPLVDSTKKQAQLLSAIAELGDLKALLEKAAN